MKLERRSVFGWGATGAGYASCHLGIVIHYDSGNLGLAHKPHSACRAYWKNTRRFHMGPRRGWTDIGYSFGVCPHGIAMEGRGARRQQAAQPGGNTTWHSITLMTGPAEDITPAAIQGVRELRAWLRKNYGTGRGVKGHRDFISTSCPGDKAYALVRNGTFGKAPGTSVPGLDSGAAAGGDDVPEFNWYSTDGGQTVPPGEWTSVRWENTQKDGKGTYWSVVFGESTYHLMAGVTLSGLSQGDRVQLCAVHMDKDEGADLPDGILKRGASGAKVERVQEGLKELGYSLGGYGSDGKYGGATEDAVRAFQRDAGITVDGEYGPQTEEAMEDELGGGSGWYTKHWFAPSAPAVADSSGSVDLTYSIPERILKGKRVRVRVRHDGNRSAKVASGNVYIHEWK